MKHSRFENYLQYSAAQTETHLRKLNLLWFCGMSVPILKRVSSQLLQKDLLSVVCMGSRNGLEPRFFREKGFSRSLGLDIAETANVLPYMMRHDFHDFKPSYIKPFDVVYSNSFDHSFDINRFLLACRSFLSDLSLLLFDYSPKDNSQVPEDGSADCLCITLEELIDRVESNIGYKLLIQAESDIQAGEIWPHYKGLKHLIFGSPRLIERRFLLEDISKYAQFSYDFTPEALNTYISQLKIYTEEHLSFLQLDSSFRL